MLDTADKSISELEGRSDVLAKNAVERLYELHDGLKYLESRLRRLKYI